MSPAERRDATKETTIHKTLTNNYIVQYKASFQERRVIYIILEYCGGGDLHKYMKAQQGRALSESKIWLFFIETCLGIQYLHTRKILHRDIKSMNLFLTSEGAIKIGDLGVAKTLNT